MRSCLFVWMMAACLMSGPTVLGADKAGQLPAKQEVPGYLQKISVLIRSASGSYGSESQGTGVIITRQMLVEGELQTVNFVLTAAHVVDNLRRVKEVIDPKTGIKRQVATFADAAIVQEFRQQGRTVGEHKLFVEVEKYAEDQDLAVLRILQFGYSDTGAVFYLEEQVPALATRLYHVGCLLGQMGANSMTAGIISQIGRVLDDKQTYDQCEMGAFPGSSGGGVYLEDGRYVGMIVRGAGETFNLMVPVRRIAEWAERADVAWVLDPSVPMPDWETLEKMPVEDPGIEFAADEQAKATMDRRFPRLISTEDLTPGSAAD